MARPENAPARARAIYSQLSRFFVPFVSRRIVKNSRRGVRPRAAAASSRPPRESLHWSVRLLRLFHLHLPVPPRRRERGAQPAEDLNLVVAIAHPWPSCGRVECVWGVCRPATGIKGERSLTWLTSDGCPRQCDQYPAILSSSSACAIPAEGARARILRQFPAVAPNRVSAGAPSHRHPSDIKRLS